MDKSNRIPLAFESLRHELLVQASQIAHDRRYWKRHGITHPPTAEELTRSCDNCDAYGWYRTRWPGGAVDTGHCFHVGAVLSVLVEREYLRQREAV